MKYLMLVLTIFFLSACDSEPVIDAKYLAINDCKYTGQSFESLDKVWIPVDRTGHFEETLNRWYVYTCPNSSSKILSLVRFVVDTE